MTIDTSPFLVSATLAEGSVSRPLAFRFENVSASTTIHVETNFSNNGIQRVDRTDTASGGSLQVLFWPPALRGPGTFTDTLTVSACRETPCVNHLAGSPFVIPVTYTVTAPPITLQLSTTALQVEVSTTDPAPTRVIQVTLTNHYGPDPVVLGGSFSTNGINRPVITSGNATAQLTIPFKDPATLAPGTYTDVINFRACLESPCVNHVVNSPQTINITYTVNEVLLPAVTFSANSLTLNADNRLNNSLITDESIGITLAPAPAAAFFGRVTFSGIPVVGGEVQWLSRGEGRLRLTIRSPSTLVPGTYNGVARVEICADAGCNRPVGGSPQEIAVRYTVFGSARPVPQLSWSGGTLSGAELITTETRSPRATLRLSTSNAPYDGLYLRHGSSTTGLITGAVIGPPSIGTPAGALYYETEITLKPPAALGSGVFTDSMVFEACFDAACAEVIPGSRYVLTFDILVTASEGVQFTRRILSAPGTATEVVWSAPNQALYVAGTSNGADSRMLQVNPTTMSIDASVAVPLPTLQRMAVSDDGGFLYVGSRSQPFVQRLRLPALAPDLSIPLGRASPSSANLVNDLAMLPGQPESFVLAINADGRSGGVHVYDGSALRALSVTSPPSQPFELPRWLTPASSPGTFLSQNFGQSVPKVNALERLTIDGNGIVVSGSSALTEGLAYGKLLRAGSRLYTFDGRILHADTGAQLAALRLPAGASSPYALLPDAAHGRIFVWVYTSGRDMVVAYDINTLAVLAYLPVYVTSNGYSGVTGHSMALWGSDGLAITDGTRLIVLSGTFFSTYRGEPGQ